MWEEDIMTKKVWDIPSFPGCNKWSDDGMLAVLTANSVQIFVPRFSRESFYLARWIQLEHLGESDVPCKKTKGNGVNESYTVSTGDDLVYWMTEVNRSEDRTFGRLDINSLYFLKALWGPPGLTMSMPSYLTTLLSDGSLLILAMGGASHTNYLVSDMGRRSNAHLFSTYVVLNIAPLFDAWMETYGSIHHNKRQSENKQKTAPDSDSDDGEEREHEVDGEEQHREPKKVITDIACYPHLLSYNSMAFDCRTDCMIMATGSSSGYINLWAVTNKRERAILGAGSVNPLDASCVCSVLLTDSMTSERGNSEKVNSYLSISCLEFLTSSGDCASSSNGNLKTRLLCGCSEGFFMIFSVTSKNNPDIASTSSSSSSSKSSKSSKSPSQDMPTLHMGQPIFVIRPFYFPIDTIVVTSVAQDTAYLRSGIQLVRVDFLTGNICPIEDIHSNVTCCMKVLESREYHCDCEGDLLMTCSLDSDIKIWEQPNATVQAVGSGGDMTDTETNQNATEAILTDVSDTVGTSQINSSKNKGKKRSLEGSDNSAIDGGDTNPDCEDVALVAIDKKRLTSTMCENYDLHFIQLFEGSKSGSELPILDLTFDPLELLMASTSLIPSTISDSREVQMNKNLERAHCWVQLTLSPTLNLKWILDLQNVIQVFRTFIYPSSSVKKSGAEFTPDSDPRSLKNLENIPDKSSYNGFYHEYDEVYFDKKSYCGLSFAWLRSFQEVILDLARGDPRTASGILTIEQHEQNGTEISKKRIKKEEDDEVEDDTVPCRAGISDVAWRVKDLLYPDVDTLLLSSFDLAVTAAITIAATMSTTSQQINLLESNSSQGETVDRLFQLFNIPIEDSFTLFLKMRLWRGLHQVLLAVPHTKGCAVLPSNDGICKYLRKAVQTGIAITSAKKIQKRFQSLRNLKDPESQDRAFTPLEITSFQIMREVLKKCHVPLSDQLGEIISTRGGVGSSSSNSSNNNGNSSNSSSSGSGSGSGSNLVESCTVCGGCIHLTLPTERDSVLCTSSCAGCSTEFDRCCITFLTVGFDSLVAGNVLKCPICSSVALQHMGRDEDQTEEATEGKTPRGSAKDVTLTRAFEWYWWGGKGPCCPYCAVLMLPLV